MSQFPCRLCRTPSSLFFEDARKFYKCPECWLIFTESSATPAEEEAHYKGQWETTEPDFWQGQVDTLLKVIAQYHAPKYILDFGSGSGEMTRELQNRGFAATPLEPMVHGYLKDQNYLQKFDTVIAVEVIEHLPDFWSELKEIFNNLAPDGVIVFTTLMTNPFIERDDAVQQFQSWWYKDDPTHVSFFCNRSLEKLAELGGYSVDVYGNNVFVLRRQHG